MLISRVLKIIYLRDHRSVEVSNRFYIISPIKIFAGALHIITQIVTGTGHARRIEGLLAAQGVVRAVFRGGLVQVLPGLAVVPTERILEYLEILKKIVVTNFVILRW